MAKSLVAYFSATGTTKRLAERLAKVAGAEFVPHRAPAALYLGRPNWSDGSSLYHAGEESTSRPVPLSRVRPTPPATLSTSASPSGGGYGTKRRSHVPGGLRTAGKTVVPFATSTAAPWVAPRSRWRRPPREPRFTGAVLANGASDARLARFVGRSRRPRPHIVSDKCDPSKPGGRMRRFCQRPRSEGPFFSTERFLRLLLNDFQHAILHDFPLSTERFWLPYRSISFKTRKARLIPTPRARPSRPVSSRDAVPEAARSGTRSLRPG